MPVMTTSWRVMRAKLLPAATLAAASSGAGKSMMRKVSSASQIRLPFASMRALVTA